MTRFRVGDLVRVSKEDILRPGDAGIVRKVLDNPTGDESLQEYIVEFGDRVYDQVSGEGFRLRVHSDARCIVTLASTWKMRMSRRRSEKEISKFPLVSL